MSLSTSGNLSNKSLACICDDDKIDFNVLFYLHEEYGTTNREAWQWLHLLILYFSVCFLHVFRSPHDFHPLSLAHVSLRWGSSWTAPRLRLTWPCAKASMKPLNSANSHRVSLSPTDNNNFKSDFVFLKCLKCDKLFSENYSRIKWKIHLHLCNVSNKNCYCYLLWLHDMLSL